MLIHARNSSVSFFLLLLVWPNERAPWAREGLYFPSWPPPAFALSFPHSFFLPSVYFLPRLTFKKSQTRLPLLQHGPPRAYPVRAPRTSKPTLPRQLVTALAPRFENALTPVSLPSQLPRSHVSQLNHDAPAHPPLKSLSRSQLHHSG